MLIRFLASFVAFLVGDRLLDGVFLDGWIPALIAAVVLAAVNALIRPILFIATFPLTLVTFGLFIFVLNALMLGLTSWLVPGFRIDSLLSALGLALLMALASAVAGALDGKDKKD
jgi:putative membrane protein